MPYSRISHLYDGGQPDGGRKPCGAEGKPVEAWPKRKQALDGLEPTAKK